MTQVCRRTKRKLAFEELLKEEALRFQAEAERLPRGSRARDLMLQRVRQAETTLDIARWLRSPSVQAPKQLVEISKKQVA